MNAEGMVKHGGSILQRVAAGDQMAVEDCLHTYGGLIWAMARKAYFQIEDAEDVVQEIFLSIWKNAGRFDPEKGCEAAFITVVAKCRLIDQLRAAYRRPQTESFGNRPEAAAQSELSINARLDGMRAAVFLKRLRSEQKELLWLNFFAGMSHTEIASVKKIPLGTVKAHIKRTIDRLREMAFESQLRHEQHGTTNYRPMIEPRAEAGV